MKQRDDAWRVRLMGGALEKMHCLTERIGHITLRRGKSELLRQSRTLQSALQLRTRLLQASALAIRAATPHRASASVGTQASASSHQTNPSWLLTPCPTPHTHTADMQPFPPTIAQATSHYIPPPSQLIDYFHSFPAPTLHHHPQPTPAPARPKAA